MRILLYQSSQNSGQFPRFLCIERRSPLCFRFESLRSDVMKFAHLIEIIDPLNPLSDPLSREQLWRGLVLRAEEPQMFVPWLDACHIVERSAASLQRELRYGEVVIRDEVTFLPQLQVHYHVPQQKDIPA